MPTASPRWWRTPAASPGPAGYGYTPDGWLSTLTCYDGANGPQITQWQRGNVRVSNGSKLNSNRLVDAKIYPDSTGTTDRIDYLYNAQEQVIQEKGQATGATRTTHGYGYDKLGRLVKDAVTAAATGIDTGVLALATVFDERGMVLTKTSYSNTSLTTVTDQVRLEYGSFNQLAKEYQAHAAAVNPSTTPKVQYSYADAAAHNFIRPTGYTYPDGSTMDYIYSSGILRSSNTSSTVSATAIPGACAGCWPAGGRSSSSGGNGWSTGTRK